MQSINLRNIHNKSTKIQKKIVNQFTVFQILIKRLRHFTLKCPATTLTPSPYLKKYKIIKGGGGVNITFPKGALTLYPTLHNKKVKNNTKK